MRRIQILTAICATLVACSNDPGDKVENNGSNNGANNGANNGSNNGANNGANNGSTGSNNGANNGGSDAGNNGADDVSFPNDIPDEITSAGARFAGRIAAGDDIVLDLSVFQADRVAIFLRKANGTDWDPSINVIRKDSGETLVWGNPQGNADAHIPFRTTELEDGYEFWFTDTYALQLENRGGEDGDFEFELECRGGPCAMQSGDADVDGTPDERDECPYFPGDCGAPSYTESGAALEDAIRADHGSHVVMNYVEARVHMFGWIDNVNGEVEGVYTGEKVRTVEIPDGSQMNTEHTWPQGRSGGDPAAESDLHHMFPTMSFANTERASLNFGVVTNPEWERGGSKRGRDAGGDTRFEPRDSHKGDVARAMFYYAVVYEQNIPAYEEGVLRDWNVSDPVDDRERRRNQSIANILKSRNPFVDDPSLADEIADF